MYQINVFPKDSNYTAFCTKYLSYECAIGAAIDYSKYHDVLKVDVLHNQEKIATSENGNLSEY